MAFDLIGRIRGELSERYAVDREIGRGAMAVIFLARDVKHEREVALKVLRPELAANLGAERFLREIKLIAQLQHPHILPLYDSGESGGCLYYVSPYVGDESLRDRIERDGPLPIADVLRIAEEASDALAHAHAHGVVHRDIKPENILLMDDHAMIADFGIARAIRMSGGHRLSEPGITLGTPTYMSPEQANGDQQIDGRTDIYSLGCVLYEMLTGFPPFVAATERQIIGMHFTVPAPRPSIARPEVTPALDYATMRALAKNPADRFQNADELGKALTAPPGSLAPVVSGAPGDRTQGRLMLGIAAALLVISAVLLGLLLLSRGG